MTCHRLFTAHHTAPLLAALAALGPCASLAAARPTPAEERVELRIRLPAMPLRSQAAARRGIAILDKAALAACGASDDSFAQMKAAVRQSACWHQAMGDAIRQSGDPRLSAWWDAHRS